MVSVFDCIYNRSRLIWYTRVSLLSLHIDAEHCSNFCPDLIEHARFALPLQRIGI